MKSKRGLSISEARRMALTAQGFNRPRPRRVDVRQLRRTIRNLGLVQIDYVNVLIPAQYQVPFSRLGPYDRERLDQLVYRDGEFTEQWAHEASIIPIEVWPLLRYRMAERRLRPHGIEKFLDANPSYTKTVLRQVRRRGPLSAADLPDPPGGARRIPEAWIGTFPRAVLEAMFTRGRLAVVDRQPNMARVFDLAERVIPPEYLGRRVGREEAQRDFILRAARSQGVATVADLADYYRIPIGDARPRVDELTEDGLLERVSVEGWAQPAYVSESMKVPRSIEAAALLSPFDPTVWYRPRTARLFDFDYRIEIYVPKPKRKWGYYVLPFLLGDRLVARVDLKADRDGRRLLVRRSHLEANCEVGSVAEALASELKAWAEWLDLDAVDVKGRRGFDRALQEAVRRSA